jgi:hypothetical protein
VPLFNFRVLDDKFFCRIGVEIIGDLGFERSLVALEGEQVVSLVLNDLIGDSDLTALLRVVWLRPSGREFPE